MIRSVSFSDLLQDLVSKHGLTTIANELDIDKAALSRFKNGDGNLSLADVDKLLTFDGFVLIPRARYKRIINSFITLSEFFKDAIGW